MSNNANATISREPSIAGRVLFVGGHPGCGKTMLTPILGGFENVEIQKFNYPLEHICCLSLLEKLERDAAGSMIRMLTDLDIYNLMLSREVNFRFKDLSSIFKNPGGWRYIRRLFRNDGNGAVETIRQKNPILQITTHNALVLSPPLFEALGERVRMVVILRHPLYMIKQWRVYVEMYGKDPRDFTIWIDWKGKTVPFFARGWEEKYLDANPMDRVIYSVAHLSQKEDEVLSRLSPQEKSRVLLIPFEHFVLKPWPFVESIEHLLQTRLTPRGRREMKRQRVPRKNVADGIGRAIYKKYGWKAASGDEQAELESRMAYAAQEATPEALDVLRRLCTNYETRYPF